MEYGQIEDKKSLKQNSLGHRAECKEQRGKEMNRENEPRRGSIIVDKIRRADNQAPKLPLLIREDTLHSAQISGAKNGILSIPVHGTHSLRLAMVVGPAFYYMSLFYNNLIPPGSQYNNKALRSERCWKDI